MKRSENRRVVITGCGVVSPAGNDPSELFRSLMSGTCFIGPIPLSFPGVEAPKGALARLPDDPIVLDRLDRDRDRARCAHIALAASTRALEDAGLLGRDDVLRRAGVVLGTTLGEERQISDLVERAVADAPIDVDDELYDRIENHGIAASVARRHRLGGPVMLNATACSSGNAATAWAYDLVANGVVDTMLAGGADTLTRLIYCGFSRMGALSKGVCRPFHKDRDGVSFGEGAGVMVLESLEHAERRGARIYAEVAGYGVSNDAYHLTAPDPNGEGFVRSMRQALATTRTAPTEVGYVSAHGTGTAYNDAGETRAVKEVFGDHARALAVSSIKSMIGHTNGAASAIESIVCALSLVNQAVPPTANLSEPDPEFGLDFVPDRGRAMPLGACLNLSAGFGGFNACVVLRTAPA